MIKTCFKRARMAAAAAAASVALSGCLNDPAMWEGIAMGLNMAADDIAAENNYRAQCYPKQLSDMPVGNANYPDMLCPGDYGYNAAFVTQPGYVRRHHHHHRDRDDRDDRRDRRERERR